MSTLDANGVTTGNAKAILIADSANNVIGDNSQVQGGGLIAFADAAKNLISGNGGSAVVIQGNILNPVGTSAADGNTVVNNYIGTSADGSTALLNLGKFAIQVDHAINTKISHTKGFHKGKEAVTITNDKKTTLDFSDIVPPGQGQTIVPPGMDVENSTDVVITNSIFAGGLSLVNSTAVTVQGNNIGVDGGGVSQGNTFDGITVDAASNNITIGGSASGQANIIADNGGAGLDIAGTTVAVAHNNIYGNTNGGVLVDGGSGVTLDGNTLDSLVLAAGDATLVSAGSIQNVTISGGSLTASASLTVSASFYQSDGTTFVNTGATLYLPGSATLNGGVLALQGGTVQDSSPLQIQSGATLAGAGTIAASLVNSGTIALGGPFARGALTVTGNYTQAPTGQLNVTLDSQSLTALDHLMVNGVATLNGNLNVFLAPGYTPTAGNVFEPLEYGSRSGTFAALNLPSYSGGSLAGHYDDPLDPNALSLWAS